MPATSAWLASLEALINRRIADVARAQDAARRLEGTSLRLDVEGAWSVRLAVRAGRLLLGPPQDAPADVRIRGTPGALLAFGLRFAGLLGPMHGGAARPRERDAPDRVRIEGDAEVAARYRDLLSSARPELEEELARQLGDLPARGVAQAVRAAGDFVRRTRRAARQDVAEYLTEESRTLVGRGELEEFFLEVDRVRERSDRIEARLARLELEAKAGAR
jgi:ubiquinone biosynthesis protein UbiJ